MPKGYRVTDEQKAEIARLADAGLFYSQIQQKTGLSRECVRLYASQRRRPAEADPSIVDQGPGPGMHTIEQ